MEQRYIRGMKEKGYRQEWPKEPYIFTRAEAGELFVVIFLQKTVSARQLTDKRRQLEDYYKGQGYRRVYHLCVFYSDDAMFPQEWLELVADVPNVWLYAADQRRVFCYERQPLEFDGLRRQLEEIPSAAGKRIPSIALNRVPWITLSLILINGFCYLFPMATGRYDAWLRAGIDNQYLVLIKGQVWRLVTSMFLHGSISHLLNNMAVLAILGYYLEPVLGRIRYSLIYLLSGIAAALFSACFQEGTAGSVGASGAIFGLSGALLALVVFWREEVPRLTVRQVALMCLASLYNGFVSVNVDNAAHIGGLITGFLLLIITNIFRKSHT